MPLEIGKFLSERLVDLGLGKRQTPQVLIDPKALRAVRNLVLREITTLDSAVFVGVGTGKEISQIYIPSFSPLSPRKLEGGGYEIGSNSLEEPFRQVEADGLQSEINLVGVLHSSGAIEAPYRAVLAGIDGKPNLGDVSYLRSLVDLNPWIRRSLHYFGVAGNIDLEGRQVPVLSVYSAEDLLSRRITKYRHLDAIRPQEFILVPQDH